jgi:hypothetical protein
MESKKSNNINSDKQTNQSTNSIGQGKAYIPFDRKKSSNGFGKYIVGALLVLALGGLATFGYKKFQNNNGSEISSVKFTQAELVKSILAITDEDEKLTDKERLIKRTEAKKEIETHLAQDSRKDPNSNLGLFKGILTKCYISGHDVHWINENADILDHVEIQGQIDPKGQVARDMINQSSDRIVVIMFEKGYEVYSSNGALLKSEKN